MVLPALGYVVDQKSLYLETFVLSPVFYTRKVYSKHHEDHLFPTYPLRKRSLILTKQPIKFYFLVECWINRPLYLYFLFQTFLQVIGVVGVEVAVIPWIAIPLVPLGIVFFVLRRYFLETSRDVKRLESTSEYRGSQVGMSVQTDFDL